MAKKITKRATTNRKAKRRVSKGWVARMKDRATGVASSVSGVVTGASGYVVERFDAGINALGQRIERWEEAMYERKVIRDAIKTKKQLDHLERVFCKVEELNSSPKVRL